MKILFLLFIFYFGIKASSSEAILVDFDNLPKMIAERNDHYKGAVLLNQAAENQTGHLLRSYLPTARIEGGQESFKTGPYGEMTQPFASIHGTLNIFRGGKDQLEGKIKHQEADLTRHQTAQTYVNELTKARHAYWNMVYQKEVLRLLESARTQNKKNLEAANKRIRSGIGSETDRMEFELAETLLNEDMSRVTLGVQNSERELKVLLGLKTDFRIDTVSEIPHTHDDSILDSRLDVENHREIKDLLLNEEIFSLKASQGHRWWSPSVDLYASHGLHTFREKDYTDSKDRLESVLGIKLTIEIFDGFQARTSAVTNDLQSEAYRAQGGQTARELAARFESAKAELKLMHELIHSAEKSTGQSRTYLSRTLSEYSRGVKNSPDVLGANQRFTEYQRRSVELKRDYQLAKSDFLAVLGK